MSVMTCVHCPLHVYNVRNVLVGPVPPLCLNTPCPCVQRRSSIPWEHTPAVFANHIKDLGFLYWCITPRVY